MTSKIKDKLKKFLPEKWPSFCQCRKIFKTLDEKEKSIFQIAGASFLTSLFVLSFLCYFQKTELIPTNGGKYIEGIIGAPQFINPIYSNLNDVDRDIATILFSGLVKHNSSGQLIYDLAQEITNQGKIYELTLKENIYWSDGEKITADDIVFTIETIQNPKARSPLRPSWIGVDVEKITDLKVVFKLEQESSIFLNRLSVQLMPKHIWKDINTENIFFSNHNLNPVGSGPYRIKNKTQENNERISSINLEINPYYHGKKPYIQEISFVFFNNFNDLINASKRKEIDGFSTISPKDYDKIINETKFKEYVFQIPRYFGLFFNQEKREILKDAELREALNHGIDKEELISRVLSLKGIPVNSPALPELYGFNFSEFHEFNPEKSNNILDNLGFSKNENNIREKLIREANDFEFKKDLQSGSQGDEVRQLQKCLFENGFYSNQENDIEKIVTGFYGSETRDAVNNFQLEYRDEILTPAGFIRATGMVSENTRKKLNELCQNTPKIIDEISFTISTVDQELMRETAEEIKRQWEQLGIKVYIDYFDITTLENEIIKLRNYEILLFGKALEPIPDFFQFWSSSQKSEYGFNLSMYENESIDKLTSDLRKELNRKKREEIVKEINDIIIKEIPAIFLFNPDYMFFTSDKIKGIQTRTIFNPSQRFHNINHWYIKTKRSWK